jgi:iron complex outermembrane recepter protein
MTTRLRSAKRPITAAVQIALLAATPTGAVLGQDRQADKLLIDEVIVTARKRNETLVEVPMNISAVPSEQILKRNLIKKEDLLRTIAGAASPRGELILRGLSGGNDSTPNTTSTFTDDIPYDFSDLFDVERVEVLRGPQGTLYGSNAIGGTVRIITKKPNLTELELLGSTVVTTEHNRPGTGSRVYAGVNVPLIQDTLGFRIVGSYGSREGKILNTFSGSTGKESDHFVRAQLMWEPSDEWNINLSFINEDISETGYEYADRSLPGYYYEAVLSENPAAPYGYDVSLAFPECTGERPECRLGAPITGSHDPKFSVWETLDPWSENRYNVYALRVAKDQIFNGADLIYAGSFHNYRHASLDNWSRADANDLFRTWITNDDGYHRYTHEMRLQSNWDKPLDWTVGAFYDETDWKSTPNGQWQYHASDDRSRAIAAYLWGYYWGLGDPTQIGLDMFGDGTKNYNYSQFEYNQRELAFFGELSYTFELSNGDRLELMGGVRNYDLQDKIHTQVSGIWVGAEPSDTIADDGEDGNRYKFSISYMPTDNLSLFAVYSEGYRPGGNNGPNAPQDCSDDENIGGYVDRYQSDEIQNYELGFKGLAFERRFQFSAAVYQIDWTGVQASVYMPSCGFSYIGNAATAESRGVEFESTTLLTETLQLQVNAAYTDSKMTSDVESLGAKDGDDMTMVPEYNFYVALDKEFVLFEREASARIDYAGYGEYKSHFNVQPKDISPAYEILNMSASLRLNENARASIHVDNVLDDEIITYKSGRFRGDIGEEYHYYGIERTVSVRLDFEF